MTKVFPYYCGHIWLIYFFIIQHLGSFSSLSCFVWHPVPCILICYFDMLSESLVLQHANIKVFLNCIVFWTVLYSELYCIMNCIVFWTVLYSELLYSELWIKEVTLFKPTFSLIIRTKKTCSNTGELCSHCFSVFWMGYSKYKRIEGTVGFCWNQILKY